MARQNFNVTKIAAAARRHNSDGHHHASTMRSRGRRMHAALWLTLLLLYVFVSGASTSVESVAVSLTETRSCTQNAGTKEGRAVSSSPGLDVAKACILHFLNQTDSSTKGFHVQGWRWHTLSLARDARRLGTLACGLTARNATFTVEEKSLNKAVHHVIEFNMKALHRIENKTFFPWLRTQLTAVDDPELARAFSVVLDDIIDHQRLVSEIGAKVMAQIEIVYSPIALDSDRMKAVAEISELSSDLCSRIQHILKVEDSYLVPAVAILVSESKQRAFNNKVIFNMGVLDSRLHLVGMYEAVMEQGETEQALFQKEIPAIPRYMIRRWKRLLYDPQASVLEESQ